MRNLPGVRDKFVTSIITHARNSLKDVSAVKVTLPVLGTIYLLHESSDTARVSARIHSNSAKTCVNKPVLVRHDKSRTLTNSHKASRQFTTFHGSVRDKFVISNHRVFGWDLPTEAPSLRRFKPILTAHPLAVKPP